MFEFFLTCYVVLIVFVKKSTQWLNVGWGINLPNILLIFLVLSWLFNTMNNSKEYGFKKSPVNAPIFVLILVIFLSIWTSVANFQTPLFGPGGMFDNYKRFITSFFVYFLTFHNINNKKKMKNTAWWIIAMVILESIVSIQQHFSDARYHYDDDMRIGGTFYRSNELGTFLAMYFPLLVGLSYFTKNPIGKGFVIGLTYLNLSALLWTYSREAYVALVASLTVFAFLKDRKILFALILLYIFAAAILPPSVYERINSIRHTEEDPSVNTRYEMWRLARFRIKESPILGHGYGTSRFLLPRDTHNMYYDMAMESGIPTVLILLWFFNRAFFSCVKFYRKTEDPFYKTIALSTACSVVAMAVCNLFGTRLNFTPINIYFMILLAMTMRARYESERALTITAVKTKSRKKVNVKTNSLGRNLF